MSNMSLAGSQDSREPKIERVNCLIRELKMEIKANSEAAVKINSCILGPELKESEGKVASSEAPLRGWLDKLIDDLETINNILLGSNKELIRLINELGHYNKE